MIYLLFVSLFNKISKKKIKRGYFIFFQTGNFFFKKKKSKRKYFNLNFRLQMLILGNYITIFDLFSY